MRKTFCWSSGIFIAALLIGCGATPAPPETVQDQNNEVPGTQPVSEEPECANDGDCADGVFCNGEERCQGGSCRKASYPCGDDLCDEAVNRCVKDTAVPEPQPEPEPIPVPFIDTVPETLGEVVASCNSGVFVFSQVEVLSFIETIDLDYLSGISFTESLAISEEACVSTYGVGTIEAESCVACWTTATHFTYQNPPPVPEPDPIPPSIPVGDDLVLIADDGTFLGNVNNNAFDPQSIANSFGTYGSTFNPLSIWNEFGTYGSEFNSLSPWSEFSSTPPCIHDINGCALYVTANTLLLQAIHPNDLAIAVGRTDVLR